MLQELLRGVSLGVPAGQVLHGVMVGDKVRVRATLNYRGPAISDSFYAAIGHHIPFFDEIWAGQTPVSFDASLDWESYELTTDILITEIGMAPWTPGIFDLYCKIKGHPEAGMPEARVSIEVLLRSEFSNFKIASYDKV